MGDAALEVHGHETGIVHKALYRLGLSGSCISGEGVAVTPDRAGIGQPRGFLIERVSIIESE